MSPASAHSRSGRPRDRFPTFEQTYRREWPAIVAAAAQIVGDASIAEQVAQDAFIVAFRRWGEIRQLDRPGAWIRQVARKTASRQLHRIQREPGLVDEPPPTEPSTGVVDDRLLLKQAIASLPARQRQAVVLYYLTDLPVRVVAQQLRCSQPTVRVHLHRARRALAGALAAATAVTVTGSGTVPDRRSGP